MVVVVVFILLLTMEFVRANVTLWNGFQNWPSGLKRFPSRITSISSHLCAWVPLRFGQRGYIGMLAFSFSWFAGSILDFSLFLLKSLKLDEKYSLSCAEKWRQTLQQQHLEWRLLSNDIKLNKLWCHVVRNVLMSDSLQGN